MFKFLIIFAIALLVSSIGFKKYVWFISIGYGFSIAAIGVSLFVMQWKSMTAVLAVECALIIIYGVRLGGYLLLRELTAKTYNDKMKKEIKSGKNMKLFVKCCIWISASLLYACQTCPVLFRLENKKGTDVMLIIGMVLSVAGIVIEAAADYQKSAAKKKNPGRFVSSGLYRIVRCPNYFGELLLWTGIFLGGITAYAAVWQWVLAILGYLGIVYVMFSGARRLEERQSRTYGDDPEYMEYFRKTPIIIPLVPLYSVVKYKWLVA